MADANVWEVSSMAGYASSSHDWNKYMSSENNYSSSEEENDIDMQDASVDEIPEEVEISDRLEDLGNVVILSFPNIVEYSDDEAKDIFDDGLDDDEDSSSDSDVSTV
jgi:hypothetical protein